MEDGWEEGKQEISKLKNPDWCGPHTTASPRAQVGGAESSLIVSTLV